MGPKCCALSEVTHCKGASSNSAWPDPIVLQPQSLSAVPIVLVAIAVLCFEVRGDDFGGRVAFALVVLAALMRSGVFPFHSWVVAWFESDALLSYAWLLSARTEVMLLAKFMVLLPIEAIRPLMPLVNDLALFSSVLMAVIAMGEKSPRRILGLVVVSQSGFVIAGLQTANVQGRDARIVRLLSGSWFQ